MSRSRFLKSSSDMVHYLKANGWEETTRKGEEKIVRTFEKAFSPKLESTILISEIIPNQHMVSIYLFIDNKEIYNMKKSPVGIEDLKKLIEGLPDKAISKVKNDMREINETLRQLEEYHLAFERSLSHLLRR